jgi:ribonuclease P/MRP protein subunit POP5
VRTNERNNGSTCAPFRANQRFAGSRRTSFFEDERYKYLPKGLVMEPKRLPPSLRAKSRYVVFEIISEKPATFADFTASVWNSMMGFLGELQASEARVWIIRNLYDEKTQRGVMKCSHDRIEHVRAALSMIQMVGETRAIVHIIGVTGTIKSARNKYLGMPTLDRFQS